MMFKQNYLSSIEIREHVARGARPEWTSKNIDDPVNMVQGKNMKNDIISGPFPGLNQSMYLCTAE